jgi:hypothetical protein
MKSEAETDMKSAWSAMSHCKMHSNVNNLPSLACRGSVVFAWLFEEKCDEWLECAVRQMTAYSGDYWYLHLQMIR